MIKTSPKHNKRKNTFILFVLAIGLSAQAQWYFETGVNGSKFAQYTNINKTATDLNSFSGLRDFSYTLGYTFPFKSLDKRAEVDGKPAALRLSIGLGFDQMNLRTLAQIGANNTPIHYNMAQAQGQLNLLFTPTLINKRNPDAFGVRRPAMNLLLEGGFNYNVYTNATRTYTSLGEEYIKDLKKDNQFRDAYPSFTFAGGLEFPISRHASLYGKYAVENAFSLEENSDNSDKETYSVLKRRVMLGLRMDLRLRNRLKEVQEKRIAALEAHENENEQPHDTVDLSPLYAKIKVLEEELRTHKHKKEKDVVDVAPMRLPEFEYVLFPLNSSYFDHDVYSMQLKDLAAFMKENPKSRLKLIGYADSKTGDSAKNLSLSERRAKRVYNYLVKQGVPPQRMEHEGAGETLHFNAHEIH
jgi:outer membrane protein OmpA-like peptidoglycan-associated protein